MREDLPGQFRVVLRDGYTIQRLPLGRAHDAWHLVFIGWPARDLTRAELRGRTRTPLADGITVEAIGADITDQSSGGHGNSSEEQRHLRFTAPGATALRVTYRWAADTVGVTEEIMLPGSATWS